MIVSYLLTSQTFGFYPTINVEYYLRMFTSKSTILYFGVQGTAKLCYYTNTLCYKMRFPFS